MNRISLISKKPSNPTPGGFTLIELLTVIAIIGILAAILIPTLGTVRESARRSVCLLNVRQIGLALQLQIDDTNGHFPSRGDSFLNYGRVADSLLPYVGDDIQIFKCPSNERGNVLPSQEIPSHPGKFTLYEFNAALANFVVGSNEINDRGFSAIHNPSIAAFAYDRPYWDVPARPHEGGMNVVYVGGNASFLRDEDMGLDGRPGEEFYYRGHDFR